MIKSCGCKIVELGHAERFEYFNESDILINKKIIQALKYNITPLVCVGEKKFNSNYNLRKQALRKKLNIFFKNITLKKNKEIILAYEPIWAIGKSKAANLKYISETIDFIRVFSQKKLKINKNQLKVIYGGSVNKKNAINIINIKNNDGIFIGRSAISARDFLDICKMIL